MSIPKCECELKTARVGPVWTTMHRYMLAQQGSPIKFESTQTSVLPSEGSTQRRRQLVSFRYFMIPAPKGQDLRTSWLQLHNTHVISLLYNHIVVLNDDYLDSNTMMYHHAKGPVPRSPSEPLLATDASQVAHIRKDVHGIVQMWSREAEELFGYTSQEMIGHSVLCLFPPDQVNEEVALIQLVQEGKNVSCIETIRCHKNGESMHVAMRMHGIWENHQLVAIQSSVRRIDQTTYNAQHMQDLLTQTSYLQRIVNHADAAIVSVDTKGTIHSWNPAAEHLFGYTSADIIGHSIQRLHTPEDHADWLGLLTRLEQEQRVCTLDTTRLHKQGSRIHVKATITPIINNQQRLVGVSVMMRSIEDSIRARITEVTLKRQSKYFEAIVNSSDDAIISNDLQGIVQSWNASAERLFGYSAKEMIGQPVSRLFGQEKEAEAARLTAQLLDGLPIFQMSTVRKRKDGSDIHVSVSMSTLTDDSNAVVGISTIVRDISERIIAEHAIWQHANFDMLTRLPNHRLLGDRALQVLPECTRRQEKAAIIHLDLDHFKEINDEFGHNTGDNILTEVAKRLSAAIRVQDTVARLGADEFVVLINGFTDANAVDHVVERIQRTLDEPIKLETRSINMSFSAGVAVYPDDSLSWTELMGQADNALYAAKKEGKNRVRYFTQDLKDKATRRRFILSAFQDALTNNELQMHYQPVVGMRDGAMIKAEALIRWSHASGMIAPMEFIPLIEQSDLIHAFGDFVVQEVTLEAKALRQRFGDAFRVTFNVSPAQLKGSKGLVEHWRSLMGPKSLEDVGLIAEITEGMMVDNDSFTQHNLLSLHSAGIGVAIDDFGTGYSSLNYPTKINAQVIKIDRSFTNSLVVSPKTDVLCEAIIAMAHKMGMLVVAEGVETREQWDKLVEMGCDMAQGYYIAKPMPLSALLTTWVNPFQPH